MWTYYDTYMQHWKDYHPSTWCANGLKNILFGLWLILTAVWDCEGKNKTAILNDVDDDCDYLIFMIL